jgi:penicillin-binding protein 2
MWRELFKVGDRYNYFKSWQEKSRDPFPIQSGHISLGSLKDSFYHNGWAEGVFLADTSHKEIVSCSFNFGQLRYFIVLGVVFLLILVSRSFWMQVVKNDYYSLLSENNRSRAEIIEPKRGIIYTQDMQALVRNKANFVVYFKPIDLPREELRRDSILRQISQILDGTTKNQATDNIKDRGTSLKVGSDSASFYKIKDILSQVKLGSLESYQPLFIADNIDYEKAMSIALELPNWPGVFLSNKIRREYLLPSSTSSPTIAAENGLSHILGYTGKISVDELQTLGPDYSPIDYVGKMGIEYSWEKELKGVAGRKNIEVDALGRQKTILSEVPAIDGANLQLTIDSRLQQKVEEVTKAYLQKANLHRAAVVIMNPNNGEILSLLSLPAYDNNLFAKGISQEEYQHFLNDPDRPLFNRVVNGEFPSGSTVKPVYAAGALEEKIITAATSVLSTGGLRIGQWFFPDWKAGGHGQTDVKKALALSVNTFFYYIGGGYGDFKGLGLDGLVKYARLFGLGVVTGIDLPGERPGFVPSAAWKKATKNESWYIGDTYHLAIGQGDLIVTPIQVANYTAAIANGGTLYKPHLVKNILGEDNKLVQAIQPVVIRTNLVDPQNLEIVRSGMRDTVTVGSARSLNTLPVEVAGKTGTAQWSAKKATHAWFIGFAPYDHPQLVITVLVEEGGEGSSMAVPIAKDILNWYYSDKP